MNWEAMHNILLTSGSSMNLIASERFSALSLAIGIGTGPSPF